MGVLMNPIMEVWHTTTTVANYTWEYDIHIVRINYHIE